MVHVVPLFKYTRIILLTTSTKVGRIEVGTPEDRVSIDTCHCHENSLAKGDASFGTSQVYLNCVTLSLRDRKEPVV